MSKKIEYDPDLIEEVGRTACPDIANYYDDITSKAAAAGRNRDRAFGDHAIGAVWSDLFSLFYDVVYESGENIRALGPTLIQIASDQKILEGELAKTFDGMESDIEKNGYSSTPSANFDRAPSRPPHPDDKDDNPFADALGDGSEPV